MSNDGSTSSLVVALVQQIAELGNPSVHATYKPKGKAKYQPRKAAITKEVAFEHLNGEQPIGCYFVLGEHTQVAVIDFDDHDSSMTWDDMAEAAKPLVDSLKGIGLKPLCCRSGGGAGLHIWLVWQLPQSAKLMKEFLRHHVSTCGFKHGTKGVLDHAVGQSR